MSREDSIVAPLRGSAEFDLVRAIADAMGDAAEGLGDDAAVFALPRGDDCIVSVDASVEGVHFRREWLTPEEIGWRAAAAAMSDLAAMAAAPRAVLLSLGLPDSWRSDVPAIARGVAALATSVGARVVGGNLSRATELSLSLTVIGSAVAPLRRTAALPGDTLYVTGRLGGPAAVVAALGGDAPPVAGVRPPPGGVRPRDELRARFAHPQPRIAEARWLAAHGAVAAVDVSDGLLADAANIAMASGVAIELDPAAIPVLDGATLDQALAGGEEYELLVAVRGPVDTVEFMRRFGVPLTAVGSVVDGVAGIALRGGGRVANAPGHDHFSM